MVERAYRIWRKARYRPVTLRGHLGTPMPPTTTAGLLRAAAVRQLMLLDGSMPEQLTPLAHRILEH